MTFAEFGKALELIAEKKVFKHAISKAVLESCVVS